MHIERDDNGQQWVVKDVNPFLPLAIIVVISTIAAILTIWMCLR